MFCDLNDVCHSKNLMQKRIGFDLTRAVKKRYNEIRACASFYEILQNGIGKVEALSGNFKGLYSIRLSANFRLIIYPKSKDLTKSSLEKCDTVIVKGVIDYHGNRINWLIP